MRTTVARSGLNSLALILALVVGTGAVHGQAATPPGTAGQPPPAADAPQIGRSVQPSSPDQFADDEPIHQTGFSNNQPLSNLLRRDSLTLVGDVRDALRLLNKNGKLNMVISPLVSGEVTVDLQHPSVQQAVEAVLKAADLVGHQENGVLYVFTAEEYAKRKQREQRITTRVYRLNYIRAIDAAQMIAPLLSQDARVAPTPVSEVGIGSNKDQVGGDSLAGGETLVIQDYESILREVDKVVAELDVRPAQVLIEAVICEVTLNDDVDLGVNFAFLSRGGSVLTLFGNGGDLNAALGFGKEILAGKKLPGSRGAGFAADTHGLKFGFVGGDAIGFVRALETLGEVNVLAASRLLVLNKQRAELIVGERKGYRTITATEVAAIERIEFLELGTQLRIRPFIATDGMIRMEIHPERSSGQIDAITLLPSETTREVTTNVIVRDGTTIVIAGLMEEEETLEQSGVPGLNRLPWIGALFREKVTRFKKKELIVLITPRIYDPGSDAPENPKADAPELPPMTSISAEPHHPRPETADRPGIKAPNTKTPGVRPQSAYADDTKAQSRKASGTKDDSKTNKQLDQIALSEGVTAAERPMGTLNIPAGRKNPEGSVKVGFSGEASNVPAARGITVFLEKPGFSEGGGSEENQPAQPQRLQVDISPIPHHSSPGSYLCRVTVQNPGNISVRSVQLVVELPGPVRLFGATQGANFDRRLSTVTWSVEGLTPQRTVGVSLEFTAMRPGVQALRAQVYSGNTLVASATELIRVPEPNQPHDQVRPEQPAHQVKPQPSKRRASWKRELSASLLGWF